MSHFIEIIDTARKDWFYFGKSVQRSHEVFELARLAATEEMPYEEFLSIFPSEDEGWGVDPVGASKFYQWMKGQPASHFVFYNDACDDPRYQGVSRWWPCRGSIYHEKDCDVFGSIGVLHVENPDDPRVAKMPNRMGGSMENPRFDELRHWLRSHPLVVIEGMP